MTEQSRKYLSDILLAIDQIEEFTLDISDFFQYEKDLKTQSAVERQLVIIDEALNRFNKIQPNLSIENDKQIISFRNRLVHAYDNIDTSVVWAILKLHLYKLKEEVMVLSK